MKLVETSKFRKLRKKLKAEYEKKALKGAIKEILENPELGKQLKGEFRELRSFKYAVKGQSRRLIYKKAKTTLVLFSFGPRGKIYH